MSESNYQSSANSRQQPHQDAYAAQATATPQPQRETIVIIKEEPGSNLLLLLRAVLWPFAKVFSALRWLVALIISTLLRSILSFIVGIVLIAIGVTLLITFGNALLNTNFDLVDAFTLSVNWVVTFVTGLLENASPQPPTIEGL